MLSKLKSAVLLGLFAAFASACASIVSKHGYMPPQEELDQLVTGVDTRASVEQLLGPAQSGGYFVDGDIYYIATTISAFGPREPKVVSRDILAISFNAQDTLENIETFTLADGRIIELARRETALPVRGETFIAQILGNIGQIDTGALIPGL